MKREVTPFILTTLLLLACNNKSANTEAKITTANSSAIHFAGETHFSNVRQLTFGGENAEAYWSFNDSVLTFQHTDKPHGLMCDQIFTINPYDTSRNLVSTGMGRTTCSFFMRGDSQIIYATTHLYGDTCPVEVPHVRGKYLWAVYPEYEIVIGDLRGHVEKQLTKNKYYDAEAVISPKGDKILFTSDRSGDLELYTMNSDGSNVKQITNELGYDGGANFSPDGSQIVWRASHFDTDSEKQEYKENLRRHLVSPMKMELFIANADGSNRRQLTNLGGANWAPNFDLTGRKVIFSSNYKTKAIPFNLFMVNGEGKNLEQITCDRVFDAFPMFSYDGKKLVWCSNRNNGGTRETNIFIADWK